MQKKLHNTHPQLENLNKQYRQLAREGRVDAGGALRRHVLDVNTRWDDVSLVINAVLRRLRHMLAIRDDFDATREALTLWLSELDNTLDGLDLNEADVTTRVNVIRVSSLFSAFDA